MVSSLFYLRYTLYWQHEPWRRHKDGGNNKKGSVFYIPLIFSKRENMKWNSLLIDNAFSIAKNQTKTKKPPCSEDLQLYVKLTTIDKVIFTTWFEGQKRTSVKERMLWATGVNYQNEKSNTPLRKKAERYCVWEVLLALNWEIHMKFPSLGYKLCLRHPSPSWLFLVQGCVCRLDWTQGAILAAMIPLTSAGSN